MEELCRAFHGAVRCRASVLVLENLEDLLPDTAVDGGGGVADGWSVKHDRGTVARAKVLTDLVVHLVNGLKSPYTAVSSGVGVGVGGVGGGGGGFSCLLIDTYRSETHSTPVSRASTETTCSHKSSLRAGTRRAAAIIALWGDDETGVLR